MSSFTLENETSVSIKYGVFYDYLTDHYIPKGSALWGRLYK